MAQSDTQPNVFQTWFTVAQELAQVAAVLCDPGAEVTQYDVPSCWD